MQTLFKQLATTHYLLLHQPLILRGLPQRPSSITLPSDIEIYFLPVTHALQTWKEAVLATGEKKRVFSSFTTTLNSFKAEPGKGVLALYALLGGMRANHNQTSGICRRPNQQVIDEENQLRKILVEFIQTHRTFIYRLCLI